MSESPAQRMSEAVRLHQTGKLVEAQGLYRRILLDEPENADALHLLGYATFQAGDAAGGLKLIRDAISLNGSRANYYCNLGVVLAAMSRQKEAIDAFRTALRMRPKFPEASYNLGGSLQAEKQFGEAVDAYKQALAGKPDWAEAQNNLGNALMELGRYPEAIEAFHKATALNPRVAEAWFNLGNVLSKTERNEEAIDATLRAIALRPNYYEALTNLGMFFTTSGHADRAIGPLTRAIEVKPDYAEAHLNLGSALHKLERFSEAATEARKAISIKPELAQAHCNLAQALQSSGRTDESMAEYRQAFALNPKFAEAHFNLSMMLLRRGEFREAWEHYDWRWEIKDFKMDRQQLSLPLWQGEELGGKGILLHIEQGFGDLIQFVRYVPLVAQRGGKIVLESHRELARLMYSVPGVEKIVPQGPPPAEAEVRCPLMSLPRIFGTTLQTIPSKVPYLWFSPQLAETWRGRLGDERRFKVGLVWNGRPRPEPRRSVPIEELAPLGQVSGVRFISLQFGDAARQIKNAPAGMEITDWHQEIGDFADTAALMANLDLILTIDSAAAHLAGALGRPTWVMLCHRADWRWMEAGEVCPWYPTMRLFRQPVDGDWATPIRQIATELQNLADKKKS